MPYQVSSKTREAILRIVKAVFKKINDIPACEVDISAVSSRGEVGEMLHRPLRDEQDAFDWILEAKTEKALGQRIALVHYTKNTWLSGPDRRLDSTPMRDAPPTAGLPEKVRKQIEKAVTMPQLPSYSVVEMSLQNSTGHLVILQKMPCVALGVYIEGDEEVNFWNWPREYFSRELTIPAKGHLDINAPTLKYASQAVFELVEERLYDNGALFMLGGKHYVLEARVIESSVHVVVARQGQLDLVPLKDGQLLEEVNKKDLIAEMFLRAKRKLVAQELQAEFDTTNWW